MAERVKLNAGHLDRRITIQKPVTAQNSVRDSVRSWEAIATNIAAHYDPGTGKEDFDGKQLVGRSPVRFTIRPTVRPTRLMRVIYAGQVYGIEDVQELGRRQWLVLVATLKDNEKP